jgi:hypothetical protein
LGSFGKPSGDRRRFALGSFGRRRMGRDWVRLGIATTSTTGSRGIVDLSTSDLGEEVRSLFMMIGEVTDLVPEF